MGDVCWGSDTARTVMIFLNHVFEHLSLLHRALRARTVAPLASGAVTRWHPGTACSATARTLAIASGKRTVLGRSLLGLRNLSPVCCNRLPGRQHRTCYPPAVPRGEYPVLEKGSIRKCRGDKSEQIGDLRVCLCFSMYLYLGQDEDVPGCDIAHLWMGSTIPLMYSLTTSGFFPALLKTNVRYTLFIFFSALISGRKQIFPW